MAFLLGARVLAAVDKKAARQIFEEGIITAESLNLPTLQTESVFNEAVRLGAFADPVAAVALFRRLPATRDLLPRRSAGTMLVQSLAQNGDFESALTLLEDLRCDVGGAQAVVHWSSDPALQRRAMVAARERWRTDRKHLLSRGVHSPQQDVFRLFSRHWRKLEAAEQHSWLDEILYALNTDPDKAMLARFGERIELHSTRDMHLFEILNVLRALKPDQVDAILQDHPDVEDAAKIYPLGLESLMAERLPAPRGGPRGSLIVGSFDTRLPSVLMAAHRRDPSAVQDLLVEAHRLYRQDSDADDRNLAPRVFWPSGHAYRQAMYWAGDRSGLAAEPLLGEIPDADLTLLASIELAAGTLGLPEYAGVRMQQHLGRKPPS